MRSETVLTHIYHIHDTTPTATPCSSDVPKSRTMYPSKETIKLFIADSLTLLYIIATSIFARELKEEVIKFRGYPCS